VAVGDNRRVEGGRLCAIKSDTDFQIEVSELKILCVSYLLPTLYEQTSDHVTGTYVTVQYATQVQDATQECDTV